jgi:hypothetical protein
MLFVTSVGANAGSVAFGSHLLSTARASFLLPMVIQDRLYRSGIKSFAELARTSPEELRRALGALAQGAKAEEWISEARMLWLKRADLSS